MNLFKYFRYRHGYLDLSAIKSDKARRAYGEKLHPIVNDMLKCRIKARLGHETHSVGAVQLWRGVLDGECRAYEYARTRQSRSPQVGIRTRRYSFRDKALAFVAFVSLIFLSSTDAFADMEGYRGRQGEVSCDCIRVFSSWGSISPRLYVPAWPPKSEKFQYYIKWPQVSRVISVVADGPIEPHVQKRHPHLSRAWKKMYLGSGIFCIVVGGVISFMAFQFRRR